MRLSIIAAIALFTSSVAGVDYSVTGKLTKNAAWLTGVPAMHSIVVNARKILIIDKAEKNILVDASGQPLWAAEYDFVANKVRGLALKTNTFCSAGAFVPNGTFYSTGGGQMQDKGGWKADKGFQSIRMFDPCNADSLQTQKCQIREYQTANSRLRSNRWYPTSIQVPSGEVLIIGGSTRSTGVNTAELNNPTYEFWPPRGNPIRFNFLVETLPFNLYPSAHVLPNGNVFVFANRDSIEWNFNSNKVIRKFPRIGGAGSRGYPLTGSSVLLPLSPSNKYQAQVLVCGGGSAIKPSAPALNTCGRINLGSSNPVWSMETMPDPRLMPDMVLLPDGTVWIGNGAMLGSAGYDYAGTGGKRLQQAYNPVFRPTIYNPKATVGKRFTTNLAKSTVARMYHSVANLLPNGRVWIAGSNPNSPPNTKAEYPTEYRVEYFSPPYLFKGARPAITTAIKTISINKTFTLQVNFNGVPPQNVEVVLVNGGFTTHSINMSQRVVGLVVTIAGTTLTVKGPPSVNLFPRGPGMIYVLNNGIPSNAAWVRVN